MSPDGYGLLHYPGNHLADVHPGQILGHDEFGRPIAAFEVEYAFGSDLSTVHVQYATPEQITAAIAECRADDEDNTERYLTLRAAGLVP